MRLALCLILALSATVAQAESMRDALTGKWALLEGSQLATDAENIVAAEMTCAQPEFEASRGLVLDFRDDRFVAEFWASGKMLGTCSGVSQQVQD